MRHIRARDLLAPVVALLVACGGDGGGSSPAVGTVSGTVRRAATGEPVAGVAVTAEGVSATTAADGAYALAGVYTGTRTIRASAAGFAPYAASITVAAAGTVHDIALSPQTVFQADSAALYLDPGIATVRGVLVYLGGSSTTPVATGDFPENDVGRAQSAVRAAVLDVARARGIALMGIAPLFPAEPAADAAITSALASFAVSTGRPELATAPVFLIGVSGGAPAAYGFAHRQPARTIAFFTWVGVPDVPSRNAAAQQVPGMLALAGRDSLVSNAAVRAWFDVNRSEGALWGIAVQPGARHAPPDAQVLALLARWMDDQLELRLPAADGPLVPLGAASGWLGDLSTFAISSYAGYPGNPLTASWLPSQASAERWRTVVTGESQ